MKQEFNTRGHRHRFKPAIFHPNVQEAPFLHPEASAWQNHTKTTKQHQLEPNICWGMKSKTISRFGFAECRMMRLLISSQEFQKFIRGAAPPARRLASVCGKAVTQRCYYRWHKCSPLLPNHPQLQELFRRSAGFSMRISDSDRMQDASLGLQTDRSTTQHLDRVAT